MSGWHLTLVAEEAVTCIRGPSSTVWARQEQACWWLSTVLSSRTFRGDGNALFLCCPTGWPPVDLEHLTSRELNLNFYFIFIKFK